MTATLANRIGELLLGVVELLEKLRIGPCFFKRIEIGALDILDERDFQGLAIREFTNEHGQFMDAGPLGSAPAAFTGDDFIFALASWPDNERLQKTLFPDGFRQLVELVVKEALARIIGTT